MKTGVVTLCGFLLALLIVANATHAETYPWEDDPSIAATVLAWMKEVEAVVRAHSDPIQRSIICRVPDTDVVITALMLATGLPRLKIMAAVAPLEKLGFVEISNNDSGQWIIKPASEEAREKMKRWAETWCVGDGTCGVTR